jgi:hypothetical protein
MTGIKEINVAKDLIIAIEIPTGKPAILQRSKGFA